MTAAGRGAGHSRLSRFRRQPHSRGRGRSAEADAARWLAGHGFEIAAVNAVTRAGEIDLIAREGATLCFVEVKARGSDACGPALAAVGAAKRRRLARAAALWLARHPHDGPCRFDVLALDAGPGGWEYTLVRDAFEAL